MQNPYTQNPYQQPDDPYNSTKQPVLGYKGSRKRQIITGASIGTAITAVIVPILVALINAHVLFPPPATPVPTTAPTQPVLISPTFPSLASFYQGTMNRVTDGSVLSFNLQQVSEDKQNGKFTASSVINGCPATVAGQVNADNTISFELQQTANCPTGSLIGVFSGNINHDETMGGQWTVPNTQIGGSWSANP